MARRQALLPLLVVDQLGLHNSISLQGLEDQLRVVRRQALLRDGGARRSGSLAAGDAIGSPDSPCSPSRRCRNVSWHLLDTQPVSGDSPHEAECKKVIL